MSLWGLYIGIMQKKGTLFSAQSGIAPRPCILVRNTIQAFLLLELCSRDVMKIRLSHITGGSIRELTITSVFLSYDSYEPPPSRELRDVITYCCKNNLLLIIGCDANAHHIILGSTNMNPREHLMEYVVSTNLSFLNKGTELAIGRRL